MEGMQHLMRYSLQQILSNGRLHIMETYLLSFRLKEFGVFVVLGNNYHDTQILLGIVPICPIKI